ncbi:21_t:CDS:2 [Funneliformis mosseae]|uniref:21_t:CDS:1 n=1 Tax=Funneliformis mosseae TaxID=27381 RepID=A0A9N9BDI2_FUNMO|nr:21_t:CDS:2 [Funneliformis mosseae]
MPLHSFIRNDKTIIAPNASLRRVINRHTKDSLLNVIHKWLQDPITRSKIIALYEDEEILNDTNDTNVQQLVKRLLFHYEKLSSSGSKKKIVDKIFLEDWKDGLNYKQVAQLDMKYYHDHSSLKHWKALKLCWEDGVTKEKRISKDFRASFITLDTTLAIFQSSFEKNWWIRISIHDGIPPNVLPISTNIIYAIYFTNSEHLLCSNIKREHKEFIMQGLLKTFVCNEIEEWDLKGKYVDSLEKLLLHRQSQGTYSRYRLNQVDDNPLLLPSKKLKKDDAVVDDDFGPNEQPSIDLTFPLHNDQMNDSMSLSATVLFEGTNVIEGLKKMITAGIAEPPLPAYLADLHSNGKNYIEVDENNVVIG